MTLFPYTTLFRSRGKILIKKKEKPHVRDITRNKLLGEYVHELIIRKRLFHIHKKRKSIPKENESSEIYQIRFFTFFQLLFCRSGFTHLSIFGFYNVRKEDTGSICTRTRCRKKGNYSYKKNSSLLNSLSLTTSCKVLLSGQICPLLSLEHLRTCFIICNGTSPLPPLCFNNDFYSPVGWIVAKVYRV